MIRPLIDRLQQLPLRTPSLQKAGCAAVLAQHGVEPWFLYSLEQWRNRWHVWRGILWAVQNLQRDGGVLETGCGCGWNLFWLAANGFTALTGIDKDGAAIAAGNDLSRTLGYPMSLRQDDALDPRRLPEGPFTLILALNWTYHVPEFDIVFFLRCYQSQLSVGGLLLIDAIDISFDCHPNSIYLTSDWEKSVEDRRPSEYVHRFSLHKIREVAACCGYDLVRCFRRDGEIPRSIYILRRG